MAKGTTKYKYVYEVTKLRRNNGHTKKRKVFLASVYIPVKKRLNKNLKNYIKKSFDSRDYANEEEALREAAKFVDLKLIEYKMEPVNILKHK